MTEGIQKREEVLALKYEIRTLRHTDHPLRSITARHLLTARHIFHDMYKQLYMMGRVA